MNNINQNKTIYYGGYGLFVDEEVGKNLFGKDTKSTKVQIHGFELVVLQGNDLPISIRGEMSDTFRIYAARRNPEGKINVRFWSLTSRQKELADKFNFGNELYAHENITVQIADVTAIAMIDAAKRYDIGKVVDGTDYNPHLNNREITLAVAREAHDASLLNKEGRLSPERMN